MKKGLSILLATFILASCGEDQVSSSGQAAETFPALPSSSSDIVTLNGKMKFWMFEGDGGCFGSISDGAQEVELWVDASSCGDKHYEENENASVDITFRTENQYGTEKMYTIISFN